MQVVESVTLREQENGYGLIPYHYGTGYADVERLEELSRPRRLAWYLGLAGVSATRSKIMDWLSSRPTSNA
jgi:hypothetical protein